MGTKTLILIAFLFLALSAFGAGLAPGIPVLTDLPAQRMLAYTAQGNPDQDAGQAFTRIGETSRPLAGEPAKETTDHPAR